MRQSGESTDDDELGGAALEAGLSLLGLAFPGAGAITKRMFSRVREERDRRNSTALMAAEVASGLTREELAEEIAADPRLTPLVTRLLHAAGMNGHDRTLRAMGMALGDAVKDREALDESEVILTALSDLTDIHVSVLAVLPESLPLIGGRPGEWTASLIAAQLKLPHRLAPLCVAALVARGLVEAKPGWAGGNVYSITGLGRVVLDVLEQFSRAEE